jgi:hypothetical protein
MGNVSRAPRGREAPSPGLRIRSLVGGSRRLGGAGTETVAGRGGGMDWCVHDGRIGRHRCIYAEATGDATLTDTDTETDFMIHLSG